MNTQPPATQPTLLGLPKLIPTLASGFDTVINRIHLIFLPVALDLFLWFGPHFSLKEMLQPFIKQINTLPGLDTPDMSQITASLQALWQAVAEQFNLAVTLRTLPVGLPSLMVSLSPLQNPLGSAPITEVPTVLDALVGWLVFVVVGLVFGAIYFNQVSRVVFNDQSSASIQSLVWTILQVFLLTLAFIVLALAFSFPAMILLPLLALISPSFSQVTLWFIVMILIWIMVPLLFSPHGIFAYHQNALISMLTSTRLVRASLPGTGLFLLAALVLSQGMDALWSVPPDTSWLFLVSIAGHAFITTGLLASSFVYYRDIMRFAQESMQQHAISQTPSQV
jgi:hypothetical protein